MIKDKIAKLLKEIVSREAELEHPANPEFGDYSTNIALKAKIDAKELVNKLKDNVLFEKVESAGPGFINFTLSKQVLYKELAEIIKQGDKYGSLSIGKGKKVQVEFISANPTGPLTIGNARGGPFGDSLASVLAKGGYQVEREYYVNDYGFQIETLGHSVLKDDEAKYKGKYIDELNKKNKEKDPYKAGEWAAKEIVESYLKKTADKLGIKFDKWLFESELYQSGLVDKVLQKLKEKSLIYEKDGAQWFKAEQMGDNRDRVVVKSNGYKTYLAGDIAHHYYKFEEKKFDKVINIWGADHHGDIKGLEAGVEAIGHKGKLDIVLIQFVTLTEKGARKKMSKRAGEYVTMDELIDEVGKDAVRFFFLQKSPTTHLDFDISLAKEQSKNNPVYYIQYAHARVCSILKKAEKGVINEKSRGKNNESTRLAEATAKRAGSFASLKMTDLLTHPSELYLIRQLAKYPEIIGNTIADYQVQRLPHYALELSNSFHQFYEQCRVLDDNKDLAGARIALIKAVQIVLNNILTLMGVSAPDKM